VLGGQHELVRRLSENMERSFEKKIRSTFRRGPPKAMMQLSLSWGAPKGGEKILSEAFPSGRVRRSVKRKKDIETTTLSKEESGKTRGRQWVGSPAKREKMRQWGGGFKIAAFGTWIGKLRKRRKIRLSRREGPASAGQ